MIVTVYVQFKTNSGLSSTDYIYCNNQKNLCPFVPKKEVGSEKKKLEKLINGFVNPVVITQFVLFHCAFIFHYWLI